MAFVNGRTNMGAAQKTSSSASTVYHVQNLTRRTALATYAVLANNSKARREGLLKRSHLQTGEGLLITPCEAIHTFGMKFPIDVVFIGKDRRVRKVLHSMPRSRIGFCFSAEIALEIPAGAAEASGTNQGDQLELRRLETGE